jgi:vacuolar-type H+-ATPase subunit H
MIESPDLIQRLRKLVDDGTAFWGLFDRTMIPRNRIVELIEMLDESLPVEIEQAREIVKSKEAILEEARRNGGEIIDQAVRKAEKLVDADRITIDARKVSEDIRLDAEVYVHERLTALEKELTRLLTEVRAGIRSVGEGGRKAGSADRRDFTLDKS